MRTRDAVVIGSGPNGLVAANVLADAGWDVLVAEAQREPGGAVRTDDDVAEGFLHDTFSAFYPMAAVSPVLEALELQHYGLQWTHAPAVLGHHVPGLGWALLHRNAADTAASLEALCPGDGEAWHAMYGVWERVGRQLVGLLLTPFPPVRAGLAALTAGTWADRRWAARLMLSTVRALGEQHFGGAGPRLLLAGNSQHADIPPDGAGSGMLGWLLTMVGQDAGFPAPRGGAGALTAALVRRLEARGGEVLLERPVTAVTVESGRASGVVLDGGEPVLASRAVLADVAATHLYGGLVPWEALPDRTRAGMRHFGWDPATVKVDWALDGPVPWADVPAVAPGTVHVADSVAELARSATQIADGIVPEHPFLVMGQMSTTDPSRSPTGTESAWAYTHVPQRVAGDAGGWHDGAEVSGRWDADDCERMADRMQARLEKLAPGFSARVRSRRVLGPHEMQRRDANLVGGAINGGTAALHQQLVLRPVPGLGRPETPIRGLFLASASAHPGGGVHGAPGGNAARAALLHSRVRGLLGRGR